MKSGLLVAAICGAFFLVSCSDQTLVTDEEYYKYKKPAAYSPDFTSVLPDPSTGRPAGGY
jgi:PBP1b-binding outer membrane lipoprotein LpoB